MISNKMKILFIGTVNFSYKTFSKLVENGYNIVGLITKEKSQINADFCDLTPIANQYNVPFIFREKNNEQELINFIESKQPDVIYCFGWSHLLSNKILKIPPYGVVGFHPTNLPNNRGRHPIIWALFLGLKRTASTFFIMDEGADTGDIISQEVINITSTDTAETLYSKITNIALKQIIKFSDDLENTKGNINKIKQLPNDGNSWRKRSKNDGKIDFRMSTKAILNLVRALTKPYVGAHLEFMDKDIKIWKVEEFILNDINAENYEPGKVLDVIGNDIVVKTYDGAVKIIEHEFEIKPNEGEYL